MPTGGDGVPPLLPLVGKAHQLGTAARAPITVNTRPGFPIGVKKDAGPPPLPMAARVPRPRRDLLTFVLAFLLIAGGLALGGIYYFKPWGTAATVEKVSDKLTEASKLPGKAIEKAQVAMDGSRSKEQERLDAVAKGEGFALEKTSPPVVAVEEEKMKAAIKEATKETYDSDLRPHLNQVQSVVANEADPEPSARFIKWGTTLKISGVFNGSPSRALIEGRLIREGEEIEPIMGVTFEGVDAAGKQIILRDRTGAKVMLRY